MDLVVDGYKGALIKSGNPPENELAKAEADLRVQYADAMGDHEYRLYCNTVKSIAIEELTLVQVEEIVACLRSAYAPQLADALNKLLPGARLVFDVSKPEAYDAQLQRALNRAKSLKLSISLKRQKLDALEQKYGKKAAPGAVNREYYYSVLLTLSADSGYRLTDEVSVWEFCELIKRHNRKQENGRG